MSVWTKIRKVVTNPKNVAAVVAAPFTAGASLAALEDNSGHSIIDALRGVTDIERQNEFNANQAQLNRDWQEEMSSTAYQRGYKDLLAAGLNPNLAGGSGGASTPAGAQATSAGLPESPGALMSNVATAGAEMAAGLKTLEESKYIGDTAKASISKMTADTATAQTATQLNEAQEQLINKQYNLLTLQEQDEINNLSAKWLNAKTNRQKAEIEHTYYSSSLGKALKSFGMGASSVLPILGPIGRFAK